MVESLPVVVRNWQKDSSELAKEYLERTNENYPKCSRYCEGVVP